AAQPEEQLGPSTSREGAARVGHRVLVRAGGGQVAQALVGGPGVMDDGAGHDDDAVACQPRSLGEVETVTEGTEGGVGAAELVPDGTSHEHAGGTDRQHVLTGVVLPLVDLPLLDVRDTAAG